MLIPPLTVTLDTIRASLTATEVTRATLPPEIAQDWVAKDGQALIQVTPAGNSTDNAVLARFTAAVRAEAPHATGLPVATQEAARTVAGAFVKAGSSHWRWSACCCGWCCAPCARLPLRWRRWCCRAFSRWGPAF
jgi:hypothetical protein